MAVLKPLGKVVIENYPEEAGNSRRSRRSITPTIQTPARGRSPSVAGSILSRRDDFMQNPQRSSLGSHPAARVLTARRTSFIKCTDIVKNAAGEITEPCCTCDPTAKGGNCARRAQRVKATITCCRRRQSRAGRKLPIYKPALCQAEAGCCQFRRRPQSAGGWRS